MVVKRERSRSERVHTFLKRETQNRTGVRTTQCFCPWKILRTEGLWVALEKSGG